MTRWLPVLSLLRTAPGLWHSAGAALISGLSLNCRLGQWPSLGSVPKTVCLRRLSLWLLSRKIHPSPEGFWEVFQGSG